VSLSAYPRVLVAEGHMGWGRLERLQCAGAWDKIKGRDLAGVRHSKPMKLLLLGGIRQALRETADDVPSANAVWLRWSDARAVV